MIYADVDQMAQLLTKKKKTRFNFIHYNWGLTFLTALLKTLKDKDVEQKMYF